MHGTGRMLHPFIRINGSVTHHYRKDMIMRTSCRRDHAADPLIFQKTRRTDSTAQTAAWERHVVSWTWWSATYNNNTRAQHTPWLRWLTEAWTAFLECFGAHPSALHGLTMTNSTVSSFDNDNVFVEPLIVCAVPWTIGKYIAMSFHSSLRSWRIENVPVEKRIHDSKWRVPWFIGWCLQYTT